MTAVEELKFNLRETSSPYFSEDELQILLKKNNGNINAATYEGLLIKAEDDSIKLAGLDIPSSKEYFLRLARKYRPNATGIIKRADKA